MSSTIPFTVEIRTTSFTNNNRAINVDMKSPDNTYVLVSESNFTGNSASGPGGAIFLDQTDGDVSLSVISCTFHDNRASEVVNTLKKDSHTEDEDRELSKVSGSGGSIALYLVPVISSSNVKINNCVFRNNTAEKYGGTLYISPYVTGILINNYFENMLGVEMRPRVGDILESRGSMQLINNTFEILTADGSVPIISYRASERGSFMESDNVRFKCPIGHRTQTVTTSIYLSEQRKPIETLMLYCVPCLEKHYSLTSSELNINSIAVTHTSNATCFSCPYGALCDIKVQAKGNFWGIIFEDEVYMYICPDGYCCQELVCETFHGCASHRQGTLCGRCSKGYSEALFSTRCIQNEECSYTSSFCIVIGLYGFIYVIFFVLEEEWQTLLSSFMKWFKCKMMLMLKYLSGYFKSRDILQRNNVEDDSAGAYMSIFMYFIQIPNILKVNIIYADERDRPLKTITNSLGNIFSFNTFGIHFKDCLFENITAVLKVGIKSAFIVYLFVVLILLYTVCKFIIKIVRSSNLKTFHKSSPVNAKFIGALVSLMMYTYQYFAENSFGLLHCINIKSQSRSVLFIDGHVSCFQTWQYFIIGVVVIYVIPFVVVLSLGPELLRRRMLKLKLFIFSLFFPLFASPYLIFKFIAQWRTLKNKELLQVDITEEERKTSKALVSKLLSDPFNRVGGLCWEGIITLRRLILVVIATFIPSILFRHILLVTGCLLSIVLQMKIKPFARLSCNIIETVSLVLLLLIAIMNLLKAAYFQAGEIPDQTADMIFLVYDWTEALLLGILPLVIIGLVILAVIIKMLTWIFKNPNHHVTSDSIQSGLPRTDGTTQPHAAYRIPFNGEPYKIYNYQSQQNYQIHNIFHKTKRCYLDNYS